MPPYLSGAYLVLDLYAIKGNSNNDNNKTKIATELSSTGVILSKPNKPTTHVHRGCSCNKNTNTKK